MINDIKYSDGDIEDFILNLLNKSPLIDSKTDIGKEFYNLWPVRYHLSSERSNSLRHLNFENMDVLELGAGMGAVSRYISENCKNLFVVEGTKKRFDCLKSRLRDRDNWEGVVTNYQDFKIDKKFDIVCFFGVLEYAGRYIKKINPFEWAINHAKSFLKEDGVLLISIENKNGIKYFAGASEDHYGTQFSGICGYSEIDDIRTFSKYELKKILENCDFKTFDLHHLSPDYKCTTSVLTDDFLTDNPIISSRIMTNIKSIDYTGKKINLFPESLALHSIAKSGILSEFSNSYLFISSLKKDSKVLHSLMLKCFKEKIYGFLYSRNRNKNVVTHFVKKEENSYFVNKFFLNSNSNASEKLINHIVVNDKLIDGDELSYLIENYYYYGNEDEIINLLNNFLVFSFEKFKTDEVDFLTPNSFDAIIKNVKIFKKEFYVFDNEFVATIKIPKSYFIFRNVLNLSHYLGELKKIDFYNFLEIYQFLCVKHNIKNDFERDCLLELDFQNELCSEKITLELIKNTFNMPLKPIKEKVLIKILGKKILTKKKIRKKNQFFILGKKINKI